MTSLSNNMNVFNLTFTSLVSIQLTLNQLVLDIQDSTEFLVWFTSHEQTLSLISAYELYRIGKELDTPFVTYDSYLTNTNNQNMNQLKIEQTNNDADQTNTNNNNTNNSNNT